MKRRIAIQIESFLLIMVLALTLNFQPVFAKSNSDLDRAIESGSEGYGFNGITIVENGQIVNREAALYSMTYSGSRTYEEAEVALAETEAKYGLTPSTTDQTIAVSKTIPLTYTNSSNVQTTANITISLSSTTLKKGTIVTVSGLPTDDLVYSLNGAQYSIKIGQCNINNGMYYDNVISYGGSYYYGYHNTAYSADGTVRFQLVNNSPVKIIFGSRLETYGNFTSHIYDDMYYIGTNGSLYQSELITSPLNNSEFNAFVYYMYNPDLQAYIGEKPQALYNHWVKSGKAENRKAL